MVGCVVLNFNDSKTTIELLNRMKNMKSIDVIVVVDNCSTDDSFSVLKQYTSKKIQVIQSEYSTHLEPRRPALRATRSIM